MVCKNNIRTNAEVVSSVATWGRVAPPKVEYSPAEKNAIRIGAKPKAYHQGFTRHLNHPANKFFISVLPPVTPVMTSAAKLGVQAAKAISKPMKMSDTVVRVTTAPMIRIAIRKNR